MTGPSPWGMLKGNDGVRVMSGVRYPLLIGCSLALVGCAGVSGARTNPDNLISLAIAAPEVAAAPPTATATMPVAAGLIPAIQGDTHLSQVSLGRPDPFGSVLPPTPSPTPAGSGTASGTTGSPGATAGSGQETAVIVTGVMVTGGRSQALIQTSDGRSQSVGVGDRLSNGLQVMAIDSYSRRPTVWFRSGNSPRLVPSRMPLTASLP